MSTQILIFNSFQRAVPNVVYFLNFKTFGLSDLSN